MKIFPENKAERAREIIGDDVVLSRTEKHRRFWISWGDIKNSRLIRYCKFRYNGITYIHAVATNRHTYSYYVLRDAQLVDGTLAIGPLFDMTKYFIESVNTYIGAKEFEPIEADKETAKMIISA